MKKKRSRKIKRNSAEKKKKTNKTKPNEQKYSVKQWVWQ